MTIEVLMSAARMLLVGAFVWLALHVFRVRNAHVETLAWRMVLLASLALPVLLYLRVAPSVVTTMQLPVIVGGEGVEPVVASGANSFSLPMAALTIYLVVALLLIARLVAGLAGMWRVSRVAQRLDTPDDVRVSAVIRSPATFGSTILLPADQLHWSADKRDAVLLHERAHVRGHDGYWSWLARFHTAVFWFSPLAWALQRRLETLAETTSDDAVVAARHDPAAYAALLLEFARQPNSRSVVMSVAESNVSARIERLLAGTPPATVPPRIARWGALALMIPAVVFAATTTRTAPAPENPAPTFSAEIPRAVVRMRSAPDPDAFYPPLAKAERVTGRVVVQVTVDPLGQVINAIVVEPDQSGERYGFSDAAIQVAQRSTFTNSSQQTATMKFMVKFAPPGEKATAAVRMIGAADPDDFYPPVAKAERVTGSATVQVTVDSQGQILNAVALEATPSDPRYGFADAAVQVAMLSRFKNSSQEPASMKFKVKFALAE